MRPTPQPISQNAHPGRVAALADGVHVVEDVIADVLFSSGEELRLIPARLGGVDEVHCVRAGATVPIPTHLACQIRHAEAAR